MKYIFSLKIESVLTLCENSTAKINSLCSPTVIGNLLETRWQLYLLKTPLNLINKISTFTQVDLAAEAIQEVGAESS